MKHKFPKYQGYNLLIDDKCIYCNLIIDLNIIHIFEACFKLSYDINSVKFIEFVNEHIKCITDNEYIIKTIIE